jgi:hypothetical protein
VLTPTDIRDEVEQAIRSSQNYLTAHQILVRLPADLRQQLLTERGAFGEGGGNRYTAITVVSQAGMLLCQARVCESVYIDGSDLMFEMNGDIIPLGNSPYACYRIRREADPNSVTSE